MKTPIELLEQLEQELAALRVNVYRAHSKGELTAILDSLLTASSSSTVALENRSLIKSLQIAESLNNENRKRDFFSFKTRKQILKENNWEAVRSIDIGIGGADYALADTGTLVLFSSQSSGRWISLAPTIHICLLPLERVLPSLDDLFSRLADPENEAFQGSALTFITGPSRTADIELTLVMGAHGPKELHVVTLLF